MENSREVLKKIVDASSTPDSLNPQEKSVILEQLKNFSKELQNIDLACKAGALESWIDPEGKDGRSWKKEMAYAEKNRSTGYVPQMTYPAIERGHLNPQDPESTKLDIDTGIAKLEELASQTSTNFNQIKSLVGPVIEKKRCAFMFLKGIKEGNADMAIENMPHGTPSEELVDFARSAYDKDLKPKPKRNPTAKKLAANEITSGELKEYFEYAIEKLNGQGWQVNLTPNKAVISVSPEAKQVNIPTNKLYSGIRALSLTAHEIGAHVGTSVKAEENGFGSGAIGTDTDVLQEGLAKVAEREVEKMLLGYETNPGPYYVLGIQKAIETNGDFWQVYDYLIDLRTKELQAQGKDDTYIKKNVKTTPHNILRRIFRGCVDLQKGGYVYTKDKAYLEGEMIAEKIKNEGLLGYMLAGKFDLETAIFMLNHKIIPQDAVQLTIDVAQKIWGNEGDQDFFTNLPWYRENYNDPYWREYGITDDEYIKAMTEGRVVAPKI